MGKRRRDPRPDGLVLEVLDDDLAVFSWDIERPTVILTAAEQEVLDRVVRGESNRTIATARKSSERTVANQVASLLRKLDASSRFELIKRYSSGARST